ncbi:MAG TPA: sigma-70 family RNA polymerase sigma factor, partial [Polyangiaceae bacterium]|nr:sigma-70 family RNA polymerase sigma factor [Polyangiaceae bacterium]
MIAKVLATARGGPIDAGALERERAHLWQLCYRMTGSAGDAEDLVQETFVRALESPPRDLNALLRPWLVRVALNLARDQLRRRKRRAYHGVWLPTPIETSIHDTQAEYASSAPSPEARYSLMESASFAFLIALEALTPSQRAVVILRDTFDYSAAEAAQALNLSETNVRVTLHRARQRMQAYDENRPAFSSEALEAAATMLQRFLALIAVQDIAGATSLLSDDARSLNDGGGVQFTARAPLHGPARIAKFFAKLATKASPELAVELRTVNGGAAVVAHDPKPHKPAAPRVVILADMGADGRIRTLYAVVAPDKLRAMTFP